MKTLLSIQWSCSVESIPEVLDHCWAVEEARGVHIQAVPFCSVPGIAQPSGLEL